MSIATIIACNREEDIEKNKLGLETMYLKEVEGNAGTQKKIPDQKLIELAHNKELINISASDAKKIFRNAKEMKPYSVDTMNLFKTAVYRFYSNISVKNKKITSNVKSGSEIGIPEDLFQELKAGIEVLNNDLSKKNEVNDNLSDSAIISSISAQLKNFPK